MHTHVCMKCIYVHKYTNITHTYVYTNLNVYVCSVYTYTNIRMLTHTYIRTSMRGTESHRDVMHSATALPWSPPTPMMLADADSELPYLCNLACTRVCMYACMHVCTFAYADKELSYVHGWMDGWMDFTTLREKKKCSIKNDFTIICSTNSVIVTQKDCSFWPGWLRTGLSLRIGTRLLIELTLLPCWL
jgi:hypothetical protein